MSAAAPHFSPKAVSFLRALKRNNDREWFRHRKEIYEQEIHQPMLALLARLDEEFRSFAPDLVATPKRSLFRIYRDTRFSADKSPLKTAVAAVFPHHALARMEGAALYFEFGPGGLWMGGGLYAPTGPDLRAIRAHIAGRPREFESLVTSPGFRREVGALEGERLLRVPAGFARDHPAAEYLKMKQFLGFREEPLAAVTDARFFRTLLGVFRAVAPLVHFLNAPLVGRAASRLPLEHEPRRR